MTIFTFFVLETILLSRLLDVNPFDQPAVEEVKIQTKKILGIINSPKIIFDIPYNLSSITLK